MNSSPRLTTNARGSLFLESREQDPTTANFDDSWNQLLATLVPATTTNRVDQAIQYHFDSGGGKFRARCALEAGISLDLHRDSCLGIARSIEWVHNASLIHDDLQDGDRTRRGRSAVWAKFGSEVAILAGDLLLAEAYAELATVSKGASLILHLHGQTGRLIRAQADDLSFDCRSNDRDIERYLKIAAGKSGPLLSLPLELPLLAADRADQVPLARSCGEAFAIGYQIYDDLGDIEDDRATESLNVVRLMTGSDETRSDDEAMSRAAQLGQQWFNRAKALTQQLPGGCADSIASVADRLSDRLGQKVS